MNKGPGTNVIPTLAFKLKVDPIQALNSARHASASNLPNHDPRDRVHASPSPLLQGYPRKPCIPTRTYIRGLVYALTLSRFHKHPTSHPTSRSVQGVWMDHWIMGYGGEQQVHSTRYVDIRVIYTARMNAGAVPQKPRAHDKPIPRQLPTPYLAKGVGRHVTDQHKTDQVGRARGNPSVLFSHALVNLPTCTRPPYVSCGSQHFNSQGGVYQIVTRSSPFPCTASVVRTAAKEHGHMGRACIHTLKYNGLATMSDSLYATRHSLLVSESSKDKGYAGAPAHYCEWRRNTDPVNASRSVVDRAPQPKQLHRYPASQKHRNMLCGPLAQYAGVRIIDAPTLVPTLRSGLAAGTVHETTKGRNAVSSR
ncbi:hypothetical protein EV363DRAFT_1301499 [Boletus edulis]|nr:hypothetical protein EV363DRAFT_1301499 [Boletus edulis]